MRARRSSARAAGTTLRSSLLTRSRGRCDQRDPRRARRRSPVDQALHESRIAPPMRVAPELAQRRRDREFGARRKSGHEPVRVIERAFGDPPPIRLGEVRLDQPEEMKLGQTRVRPCALLGLRVAAVQVGAKLGGLPALVHVFPAEHRGQADHLHQHPVKRGDTLDGGAVVDEQAPHRLLVVEQRLLQQIVRILPAFRAAFGLARSQHERRLAQDASSRSRAGQGIRRRTVPPAAVARRRARPRTPARRAMPRAAARRRESRQLDAACPWRSPQPPGRCAPAPRPSRAASGSSAACRAAPSNDCGNAS